MKKILNKLVVMILAFVTALSFTGCSLFESENTGGTNNPGERLPDSTTLSSTVVFDTLDDSERVDDLSLAAEKVFRAGVAINIQSTTSTSRGSGILVDIVSQDENGQVLETENEFYILTCHHVIADGGDITVYLTDKNGRNFGDIGYDTAFVFNGIIDNKIHDDKPITLVGGDKESDVAVLKLDLSKSMNGVKPEDIATVSAPREDYLPKLAEKVLALGNPGGALPGTVSVGVVSYIDRQVTLDIGNLVLLQHDASIDHGSSGGGLFNAYGELIGITNAGSDTLNNIFYAVPHKHQTLEKDNGFVTIAKQLIGSKTATNYGYVSGRWMLGITVNEITDQFGGVYVSVASVVEGSNADHAGIIYGDIITSVTYVNASGETIETDVSTNASFAAIVNEIKKTYSIGDSFTIGIKRLELNRYVNKSLTVTLAEQNIFCDTGN